MTGGTRLLWDLLQNAGIDGRSSAVEAMSVPSLVACMLLGRHNFFFDKSPDLQTREKR